MDIQVHRDAYGIPHIEAQSEMDAWYAMGYTSAQDRLWQMEFQIKADSGELSEILGEQALKSDISKRRNGIITSLPFPE